MIDVLKELCLRTDEDVLVLAKLLAVVRRGNAPGDDPLVMDLPPDLKQALRDTFNADASSDAPASEVVAVRHALLMVAEDNPDELRAVMQAAQAQIVVTITAVTAALVILQTDISIKRGATGKWTFEFKKRAASDGLLKSFVTLILKLWA